MPDRLDELADRLERAAAELRGGELAPERAAPLVEECARLAAEAGAELDRQARAVDAVGVRGADPGQLALEAE